MTTKGGKKRINTREKGRRKEMQVRDIFIKSGYTVQLAPPPTRWARQTDLYGLWDLIAFSSDDVVCIQVKTNMSNVTKAWKTAAKEWKCPSNCRKELWIMGDRKKPRIITL